MRKAILVMGMMAISAQASAEKDLIKCSSKDGNGYSTLRVFETSLGIYGSEVFECTGDCRNPRDMYYRKGAIRRNFSGNRPAMTFSQDDVRVFHIFGAEVYSDGKKMLEFQDAECADTPPEDSGLIVGFADLEPGPCGTPESSYEAMVKANAQTNAQQQCPLDAIVTLQEVQVESFCLLQGKGNLYLRAAGLFKCKYLR